MEGWRGGGIAAKEHKEHKERKDRKTENVNRSFLLSCFPHSLPSGGGDGKD